MNIYGKKKYICMNIYEKIYMNIYEKKKNIYIYIYIYMKKNTW